MVDLTATHFHDADKARDYLEGIRWPEGPVCPKCGNADENIYRLGGSGGAKGTKARPGTLKCGSCRKQFSVTVGTVFERSKVPLNKWLLAVALICASKKGYSSHQLHRTLGVTYKTAWFMSHRIREAMREENPGILGTGGGTFEIDETFIGGKKRRPHGMPTSRRKNPKQKRAKRWGGYSDKAKVFSLVDRSTGKVRSFHVADVTADTLRPIIWGNIDRKASIHTDEATQYNRRTLGRYANHESVNHSRGEYARGHVTTNRIEGFFSILKRGIYGIYQHVSQAHLHRYLAEFDLRYSLRKITDAERMNEVLRGIEGKRLRYAEPSGRA